MRNNEADETDDMQNLARRRWEERAARMGITTGSARSDAASETARDAVVRFGITGGEPPQTDRES